MTIALLSLLVVIVGCGVPLAMQARRQAKAVVRALEPDWKDEVVLAEARKLDALYPNTPILPPLIVAQDKKKREEAEEAARREEAHRVETARRRQLDEAATTAAERYYLHHTKYKEERLPDGTRIPQAFIDLYGWVGAIERVRAKEKKPS